ncbi:uncharacterized protein [Parasteatoda tepidariorum]|uniref:uncharacterized protein isoform X2 n=1 Tax=Parasteatoda tepidariorum TaxID=114398 RepID=UPI0039BCEFFB
MAIINGCCCWRNVRSGSFAAGFYVLILYTIILTAGVFQHFFHHNAESLTKSTLIFTIVLIVFSICCVITSVLLLVGLCVDSRMLLIPWLVSVLLATVLDALMAIYLIVEASYEEHLIVLFLSDVIILGLNVYSLLCVYAQYQEYCAGRGHPQFGGNRPLPPVEYHGNKYGLSKHSKLINESRVTNSSTISAMHSSGFAIQSDIASV